VKETIEQVKRRVSRKYLALPEVHGVGILHSQNVITLYVHLPNSGGAELLARVRQDAEPYGVVLKEDEPPVLAAR
jgi:hypothetical protein